MNPILTADRVFKSYGKIGVLRDVSLTIAPEEGHVVIGPNGAGKTTLFNCLSRLYGYSEGRITFDGRPPCAAVRPRADGRRR